MPDCSTHADQVACAAASIRERWHCEAATAVILGTGLGELADEVTPEAAIDYREIPGFPCSTALAHRGRLVCGRLGDVPVLMLQGRCHLYEGYAPSDVTLPVRVLAALGIKMLIVTNAAGGLNPDFAMGDIMLIDDHINLMGLAGQAPRELVGCGRVARPFARMYDSELAVAAEAVARRAKFPLRRGVYIAVTGPSYETRAEYRAFRRLGGDCVGMSTVPEVLTAVDCGLRVLGLSTITNVAIPDAPQIVSAEDVVRVANVARPRVQAIVRGLVTSPAKTR